MCVLLLCKYEKLQVVDNVYQGSEQSAKNQKRYGGKSYPFFVVGRLYESQDCILSLSNKYLIYIKVKDIFRYTNLYQEYLNKISAQLHRLSQKQKLNKI